MTNIPAQTSISAISVNQLKSSLSPKIIAENTAPKSGFVLLNTATFETGLYLKSTPCNVNAVAERFGGGGHVLASGCMLFGEYEEVVERLTHAVYQQI